MPPVARMGPRKSRGPLAVFLVPVRAAQTDNKSRRSSDLRDSLLDEVAAIAQSSPVPGVDVRQFVLNYYRQVDFADLQSAGAERLARDALGHLEFAASRRSGRPKLRVFIASEPGGGVVTDRAVVEVVNDDMPFLIDSLSMAIADAGLGIELTVHPVFAVSRDTRGKLRGLRRASRQVQKWPHESLARFVLQQDLGPEERQALAGALREVLADVRAAVRDWPDMLKRMARIAAKLRRTPPDLAPDVIEESLALLDWLVEDNFTFLGYRYYAVETPAKPEALVPQRRTSLGILRRPRSPGQRRRLTKAMLKVSMAPELLIITKANSRSTIHRPGYLDYIGIKAYDSAGRVAGEHRFLGLFTSSAYSKSPRDIPILRRKLRLVLERSGLQPGSHRGKALIHILEKYPRDELLQASVADLVRNTQGILNLQERRRVRLFVRRDPFGRFVNCILYVPRDRYNTQVRERIEAILCAGFSGNHVESVIEVSESVLARLYLTVRLPERARTKADMVAIEAAILDSVVTWQDRLDEVLLERNDGPSGRRLVQEHRGAFPAAYQEDVPFEEAYEDIDYLERVANGRSALELCLRWSLRDGVNALHFKLIRAAGLFPLSSVLPILENFGMHVVSERPYRIETSGGSQISLQDVEIRAPRALPENIDEFAQRFTQAFRHALERETEDDGLNRLVVLAELDWREVVILRAYSRYLQQSDVPFSPAYMSDVLCAHGAAARALVRVFEARLQPGLSPRERREKQAKARDYLNQAMDAVTSLDDDRILRAFEATIKATVRTNYYRQMGREALNAFLSFKLDSAKISWLPDPKPRFEIFVYSPDMEGIHLRAGLVARGGIRWSDRREDFRTEVLGLMKAQIVKNAVIVPTGAKGGFVVKTHGDPSTRQPSVENCYRNFIRGLLDVTDNLVDGRTVSPADVHCIDQDDAYLVVAADKGTATFSDTANEIAAEYGFWLGDGFASGGSAGYDHKKMGITARGAWEAVKRHFLELGKDIQSQPFTVVGIGDMGGDVFGNGMLLSRHIRLLAAFNHRHIFLDPDPDPERSFRERQRLFRQPGSSWTDYRAELISSGGGVFERQRKKIQLSPQSRDILGAEQDSVTPPELIKLILRMPVELLWNGGIGTYVKASAESHADVGDQANDAVRVDAGELRCQVVGEGGNLGLTQRARIEFALAGGRVNTDAVDNSAGVDCSDREVNIKILLQSLRRAKRLSAPRRDRLLAEMTKEVAQQVLRDNYLQTQAISVAETYASERLPEYGELLRQLEQSAQLDRRLEALPDEDDIRERRKTGGGLTRPELATVISYAKIHLFGQFLASDLPEQTWLDEDLVAYFPSPLSRYRKFVVDHPLRPEIIATQLANSIVNRMGPTFVLRMHRETSAEAGTIAAAYTIAREVLGMRSIWAAIEALDSQVPSSAQYAMLFQATRMLGQATHWLLEKHREKLQIDIQVERLGTPVRKLLGELNDLLSGSARRRLQSTISEYEQMSVPRDLAARVSYLNMTGAALDAAELAEEFGTGLGYTAAVYSGIGRGLKLDWLRAEIEALDVVGRWQALARRTLRQDLLAVQRQLTAERLSEAGSQSPEELVVDWLSRSAPEVRHVKEMLLEIRSQRAMDFAALTVAIRGVRSLST
jgi:glutamate dehydrogenase